MDTTALTLFGGARYKVLASLWAMPDPVDCLVSRFENLRRIAGKPNEVGTWQARMAIAACRAYVEELIRLDDERKAIRIATALFQLAGSATGLQAYAKHGLDILDAIPLSRFSNANFRNEQAGRSVANILKARENLSAGTIKH